MTLIRLHLKLCFLLLLTTSFSTWAGCSGPLKVYAANIPNTTLSIPQNKTTGPIGSVISIAASTAISNVACSAGTAYTMLKLNSAMTLSSIPDVYNTNVPGIGVKFWDDFSGTVILGNTVKYWYSPGVNWSGNAWLTGVKLQFYVTGPVTPGDIQLLTPTVEAWLNTAISTAGATNYNSVNIGGTVSVKVMACETPDITVELERHYATEFSGIGSKTSSKKFDFKINNCGAGLSSVNYTFKPAPGINVIGTGSNQYISLDSSSTALGVGIQVLYDDGTNVPLNTKIKYAGYTGAGNYIIPMRARYIQTGNVRGGTANSAVEFTMSYE